MSFKKSLLIAVCVMTFGAQKSLALNNQFIAAITAAYANKSMQADDVKAEVTNLNYAVMLGYTWVPGLTLGLKYFRNTEKTKALGLDTDTVITGYGPLIGFIHQTGFYAYLTYLLSPVKEDEGIDGISTFKGGNGHIIQIGRLWQFGGWGAGLELAYTYTMYNDVELPNGAEMPLQGKFDDTTTYPNFAVYFLF